MVDFDLEDLLKGLLPRKVGTFTLTKVIRVDENDWQLVFENPGVTLNRDGVVTLLELRTLFQWGYISSGARYKARFRARKETNIPIRAEAWLRKKMIEQEAAVCPSGVRNRIRLEERDKYYDVLSMISIEMNTKAASALVLKQKRRLEEFLVSFDRGFLQIAMDAISFVHLDLRYGTHIKSLSS